MRKQISVGVAFGLLFTGVALSVLLTAFIMEHKTNALLGNLPEKQARYEVLDELDSIIAAHYYGSGDSKTLRSAIAKGYVSGLPDGYSRLMTAEEYKQYLALGEGQMQGVGIEFSKTDHGTLRVDAVAQDSPAQNAGLKKGDEIVALDALMLDESNVGELSAKLENDGVASVGVTFRRGQKETTVDLEKGYEASSVKTDTYQNIGYLAIYDFYASTASQVKAAVDTFLASGVSAIVLDVRSNSGESVENAMKTLDVFVPLNSDAPAATLVNKAGEAIASYSTAAGEVNLPIAVLVSGNTQSAAELFACDLRDFGKAQLVGTQTKGNALVRECFRLSGGDSLLLSVGEMLPYKSKSFHKTGLAPDVKAVTEGSGKKLSEDSQFLAAAALFLA